MKRVIRFSTQSCGPCKMYAPIFDKVSQQFEHIESQHIDCATQPEIARSYGVRSVPSTVFISEDGTYKTEVGLIQENELSQFYQQL